MYKTLAIKKVNVDSLTIADFKDYRPDNKTLHDRKLEATYDFTITGSNNVYFSKATIASADSVVWQMKTLVIEEKHDSSNTITKKVYRWDLSKDPVKSVTITKVTKS